MDKISKIREKHQTSDVSELTEKIIENLKLMKNEDDKKKQIIEEQELELRTVSSKLTSLLNEMDKSNSVLDDKIDELKKYKEEIELLDSECKQIEAESLKLQLKRDSLINKKPNPKDQATLEQGVNKFHLLKQLSGIRWNFETLEENTSGYIHNKDKNYIHAFDFDSKIQDEKLSNALWEEIEKSTNPPTSETKGNNDKLEKK
ncbi:uncharacterized protein LOC127277660 [Leptopilina boulardi]|uniref:uncharacterized protein LOC127277660 n=1 Tax=Leptopilina boulardi TaxID=63433 RepID=UPI0021F664D9|nr:uncharacterized protein LOC127277660 [Leptopilina boulardi]